MYYAKHDRGDFLKSIKTWYSGLLSCEYFSEITLRLKICLLVIHTFAKTRLLFKTNSSR